jgi:chorismate dehydratase
MDAIPHFGYHYDLATAWIDHTGLPFVFATWIANKPIPADFMEAFDDASGYGVQHLDKVIEDLSPQSKMYDLNTYFTQNISYNFDEEKKKGLDLFLSLIK